MKLKSNNLLRWIILAPTAIIASLIVNLLWAIISLFFNKLFTGEYIPSYHNSWFIITSAISGFIAGYILIAVICCIMPKYKENIAKASAVISILAILYIGWSMTAALVSRDFVTIPHDITFFITIIIMVGNKTAWWKQNLI
jgi:ABC-type Na+ efflux pump permease subunit